MLIHNRTQNKGAINEFDEPIKVERYEFLPAIN